MYASKSSSYSLYIYCPSIQPIPLAKFGFGPTSAEACIPLTARAAEGDRHFLHFRLLCQMLSTDFHLFHYIIDAIPVGIKHVRPEIRLIIEGRSLRIIPMITSEATKSTTIEPRVTVFPESACEMANQIERFAHTGLSVSCFRFQDEVTNQWSASASTQLNPSEMASTTKKRFHDFPPRQASKVERENRTEIAMNVAPSNFIATYCSVYQRFPGRSSRERWQHLCSVCYHDGVIHQHPHSGDDKSRQ